MKLEAAILILETQRVALSKGHELIGFDRLVAMRQIRYAIYVLEAVPLLRETIVEFLEWGPMTGSDLELHRDRFRALLSSLPEPEEEK